MEELSVRMPHQEELLAKSLQSLLGEIDAPLLALLERHLSWLEVPGGQPLMKQGDPGDAMYLVVSGRLRATVRDPDGKVRRAREMGRGEVIGELSLYTGEKRSATVTAIRESVLVRLDRENFAPLLAASPPLALAMTRQIIHRLEHRQDAPPRPSSPVTIGLVPVSDGLDLAALGHRLAEAMRAVPGKRVRLVDAAVVEQALNEPGLARRDTGDEDADRRIARLIDRIEAEADYVVLVADADPTPWTWRCARHADELLLLADAAQPPALHRNETECLMRRPANTEAAEVLVLLHPETTAMPRGTRAWRARRPVADHVHIRPTRDDEIARLARIVTRTAVGLVLAGGGARGFAHLGVWRAMREAGIPIDFVGGTSMGAVMAALIASDRPVDEVSGLASRAFALNPTGDFNLLPMLSLMKGRRLRRVVQQMSDELMGFSGDAEDLWKGFYCVATNYSLACESVLRDGPLAEAVLASVSIPGALPPIIRNGELMCDGGTFNNFPVDVMHTVRGVGVVAGVDLLAQRQRRLRITETPSSWQLLLDRFRAGKARRYRLPSLAAYMLNVSILYSSFRHPQAKRMTDLYLSPPSYRVGMLEWTALERVARQGYEYATAELAKLDPALRARFGAVQGRDPEAVPEAVQSAVPGPDAS